MSPRKTYPAVTAAAVLLTLLAAVYLTDGFGALLSGTAIPGDLRNFWIQQRAVASGHNPGEFKQLTAKRNGVPLNLGEDRAERTAGLLRGCSYPPWAMLTLDLIVPPVSQEAARRWFAAMNAIALLGIAAWAYASPPAIPPSHRLLLAGGALAVFSNAVVLRVGQISTVMTLFLVGMSVLECRGRSATAGLMLALAAAKPHMSAPFGALLLMRGRWKGLATLLAYLVVSSAVVCFQVGESPWKMFGQLGRGVSDYAPDAHLGILDPLKLLGLPASVIISTGLLLGGAITAGLVWRFRERPTGHLMAIAAVVGQLWTYHRRYDEVVIVLLLVALGRLAVEQRTRIAWTGFVIVGLSLWLPHRDVDWYWVAPLSYAAWIAGLAVLLRSPPLSNGEQCVQC
jgi:hypothetical protein